MEISSPQATILAALIAGFLLLYVHRRNAYRVASAKFRAAVLNELKLVYPLPVQWPRSIDTYLRAAFPQLQAAVAEFRPAVSFWRRSAFDAAWATYRNAYGREQDAQVYHHYMGFLDMPDAKATFKQNVDRLLAFSHAT